MNTQTIPKKPFDIDVVMAQMETAVKPYPKAAMFELAQDGYRSLFEQLIACIISIRTYDEVSLPTARQLFARANTPETMLQIEVSEIDELIRASTFHERKAEQIRQIAQQIVDEFSGNLPCDRELLLSFAGVGPKCANLALAIACDAPSSAWMSMSTGSPTVGATCRPKPLKQRWKPYRRNCQRNIG